MAKKAKAKKRTSGKELVLTTAPFASMEFTFKSFGSGNTKVSGSVPFVERWGPESFLRLVGRFLRGVKADGLEAAVNRISEMVDEHIAELDARERERRT